MSALNLRVKMMPCVKTFLEVTDASVNPDFLDETAKTYRNLSCLHLKFF